MLCAVLCTCIIVLGGILAPLQAYLYLGKTCTKLVGSSIAYGMCCCTSITLPVLQGMLLPALDLPGCTQQPWPLYCQMVVHYNFAIGRSC